MLHGDAQTSRRLRVAHEQYRLSSAGGVARMYAADITDSILQSGAGRMRSLKRLELLACEFVSGDEF